MGNTEPGRRGRRWLSFALAMTCAHVFAGDIQVSPIRIDLDPDRQSGTLLLRNNDPPGSPPSVIQVDTHRWVQPDSTTESLEPTTALRANPPLFTLPAGGEQIVRIGFPRPHPPGPVETSYRLIVQQVPPPPGTRSPTGLSIQLRFSIPVFVAPVGGGDSKVEWSLTDRGDELLLSARNSGSKHIRLDSIELRRSGDAQVLPLQFAPRYVLAGALRTWHLALPDTAPRLEAGETIRLKAVIGHSTLEADIPVGADVR